MRLVHYPHAPYSRKVLLAAYETETAFDSEICPPFSAATRGTLDAFVPLATVPLLIDGDLTLTESSIIVEHFDLLSTRGARLLASDPREALRARAIERFCDANLIGPTVYLAWSLRKPEASQNGPHIAAERTKLETALSMVDGWIGERRFVLGDQFSFADLSPAAAISCLLTDGTIRDLDRWKNVARWYHDISSRPSFARIVEECRSVSLPPGYNREDRT